MVVTGTQQCMDGLDEDNCEELEYNECQENEYRCKDGSCIAEQYWLDGEFDCSDMSDEQSTSEHNMDSERCPLSSSRFNCDEITAGLEYFACGDGQFVRTHPIRSGFCYNYRQKLFFCEYQWHSADPSLWTLANGHCVDKVVMEKTLTEMNESEKCVFFLKCKLMHITSADCGHAIHDFPTLCKDKKINYPTGPFFKPYGQTIYQINTPQSSNEPTYLHFDGTIKCIGYQALWKRDKTLVRWRDFIKYYPFDTFFCRFAQQINMYGPQFDKNCWNSTKQSFLCQESHKCISKYRVLDNIHECFNSEDEKDPQGCQAKGKHQLSCLFEIPICLSTFQIGEMFPNCDDGNDIYIIQLSRLLEDFKCKISNSIECRLLKDHIQSPSVVLTAYRGATITFRQFCDTLWDLPKGFDESMCNQWKCPKDQFQCLSGHCVSLSSVKKQELNDWHCPDASDKAGLFRIVKLSAHNARLINNYELETIKSERLLYNTWFDAFNIFCNRTLEYPCILANVNEPLNFAVNRPCINLIRIGDDVIDCYGGLDERNVLSCGNNTSQQRGFDFHCSNEQCIPYSQHCTQRCSNNADTLLCDQLPALTTLSCRDSQKLSCDANFGDECKPSGIDEFYCDNSRSSRRRSRPYRHSGWQKRETFVHLSAYPQSQEIVSPNVAQLQQRETIDIYSNVLQTQQDDGEEGWICGRGIATRTNKIGAMQCFCPPSLFGEYCQHFSDRITVIISLYDIPSKLSEQSSNIIKILALLLSDDQTIDHRVIHLSMILSKDLNKKFRFNLIHQRPKLSPKSYTIRFEAYYVSIDLSIKFLAVWEYAVQFPFLPSYRLAQVLKFEKESIFLMKSHICQTANPCGPSSICHPIMNKLTNISALYCYCNSNSFGKICEHSFSRLSLPINCSIHAVLRPLSLSTSICLCPAHLYGPTCHINHTCEYRNPCGAGRGKCFHNPENMTHDYICVCDKKYFGYHCEFDSARIRINFTKLSFVQSPSNFIMSSIIQLCDLHNESLELLIREKRVYQGLPPLIIDVFHNNHYLPVLGLLKLYHKQDLSNDYLANLKQPEYFLLHVVSSKVSRINITSMVDMENYCPHTGSIFQKNISHIQYLSQFLNSNEPKFIDDFNVSIIIFKYHLLCNPSYSLMCLHDDNYFCVCDIYGHAECSRYDSIMDECAERCLAGGQCIRGDLEDRKDFVCLCPRCYYGSICQHNTELFSFTLETLLTYDLYSLSVAVQQVFSSLLIIIPAILFVIGALNNVCCYATFNRTKPLLVGIGHYLRTVSIINQLALLSLLLKLIHTVFSIKGHIVHHTMNTISCKILSYFLSCTSRMSYWLMGMVAVERVYVTWYLKGTWLKSPRIAKCIIATIIVGIVVSNIHEVIFYQSIEDPKSSDTNNSTWCVTSYPSIIATYNQANVILNYIMPFLINFLSTIILTILIIRKKWAIATKKISEHSHTLQNMRATFHSYRNLFTENKELILAPLITMLPQLFSLPQFILSFSLACQELKVSWQRYLLIVSYFITYLPQVLSYKLYVSPSSFYKKEFNLTKLGKKITKWQKKIVKKTETTSVTLNKSTNQAMATIQ
ncbi:unnamed protein product [Rotaria socialis]